MITPTSVVRARSSLLLLLIIAATLAIALSTLTMVRPTYATPSSDLSTSKRFDWRKHPELEDRSKRTHTTKEFQDPNDPSKRIIIESFGNLHAYTDKGFQDINTELPNYSFPNGMLANGDSGSYPIMELPSWGNPRVEDNGATVRVYDKLGHPVFVYRHLISVPQDVAPYEVVDKSGTKVRDAFRDTEIPGDDPESGAPYALRKSAQAEDLTWNVQNGQLYALFPSRLKNSQIVQLYDATDNSSTNNSDTHLSSDSPDNPRGSDAWLVVQNKSSDAYNALINFTLPSSTGTISAVKLYLYQSGNNGSAAYNIELHEVRRAWTEAGATWNKYDGTNNWTTPGGLDTSNDIYSTIVNSWARTNSTGWMSGKDIGPGATNPISGLTWASTVSLMMKPASYGSVYDGEYYDSKEGTYPPYLQISFTPISRTVAVKTQDTSRNSVTTPTNDAELFLGLSMDKSYIIDGTVFVTSSNATPDFKLAFSDSSVSAMTLGYIASDSSNHSGGVLESSADSGVVAMSADTPIAVKISGTITMSSSDYVRFKWAQNTSDAAYVTVLQGSYLRAVEIE